MLKTIDPLLNGDLLKVIRDMGHGDEIVLADANFPAMTLGVAALRYDGVDGPSLLKSLLKYFPLDQYDDQNIFRMAVVEDPDMVPEICRKYQTIVDDLEPGHSLTALERFAFYQRASKACCVIATGERAQYANLILKKGVVVEG